MKLESVNPSDNWQERVLVGHWVVPGLFGRDENVFGELRFDGLSSSKLKLLYNPKVISLKDNPIDVICIERVYGECTYHDDTFSKNTEVLLFNCFVAKAPSPLDLVFNNRPVAEVTITVQHIWLGHGLKSVGSKEDLRFREFSFGIKGLEEWCDDFRFTSQLKTNPCGIKLDYLLPQDIYVYDDRNVCVKLRYSCNGPSASLGQTELKLAHHARLCITVKDEQNGLPYYGEFDSLEFYSKMLTTFFSLFIGDCAFAYDLKGCFFTINDAYFYTQRTKQPASRPRNKKAPYTVYKLISQRFLPITNCFFQAFRKHYGELWSLNKYVNSFAAIDEKSTSELLFAFDGLFDVVFKTESDSYFKLDSGLIWKRELRTKILNLCDDGETRTFVAQNIHVSLSYAQKMKIALNTARKELPCLLHETDFFCDWMIKQLRRERVSAAHALATDPFNERIFFAIFETVKNLLMWMIMRKSGFSVKEILHVLTCDYDSEWSIGILRKSFVESGVDQMFSIIIPVYNVAPYLKECLCSLLAQTYRNWEAICVDDGSTDDCAKILDEFRARDSRIKVIHQKNVGVSAARNVALKKAKGEWLFFLDGDDVLHPRLFEEIAVCAEKDVDIIFAKHQVIKKIDDFKYEIATKSVVKSEKAVVNWEEYFHPIFATAYRASKFEGIRFKEGLTIGEDRLWHVLALDVADKTVELDFPGYGYRLRDGSATTACVTQKKFCDEISHFVLLLRIIKKSSKKYDACILRRVGQSITEYASKDFIRLPKADRKGCLKIWIEIMRQAVQTQTLSKSQRMLMRMCIAVGESSIAVLSICYLPYWLKSHGLHR